MELIMMGTEDYEDTSKNYGDCTVIIGDGEAVVYDCGSKEHAERVIKLLKRHSIKEALFILSHNDDDHFKGVDTLIDEGYVKTVYTVLLLKYKDEILRRITDDRVTRESVGKRILKMYDNIASLGDRVELKDAYIDEDYLILGARLIGPDKEYMLDTVAKGLDPGQGDTKDDESITNATSLQIGISIGDNEVLLTGDCPPEAIPEDVDFSDYDFIQLPHHGKKASAEKMFERADRDNSITWIISDNTGNSNGGSDNRAFRGRKYKNTRIDGDISVSGGQSYGRRAVGGLGL